MSAWNYDMSTAPRGKSVVESRMGKDGNPFKVTVYKHAKLILGGKCGTVTVSRWLPDEQRWEMFPKHETPLAWMPWPTAPEVPS